MIVPDLDGRKALKRAPPSVALDGSTMRGSLLVLLLLGGSVALAATPEKTPQGLPTKRPPDRDVGERLWKQSCWQCHGEKGKGDGPAAAAVIGGVPTLEGKVKGEDFEPLVAVIQAGRGRMPAYAEDIDKHDSRRILVYLRDVLEGRGPPPKEKGEDEDVGGAEAGGQ